MRFYKAESAFFVFMALVLGACLMLLFAYDMAQRQPPSQELNAFGQLLLAIGCLLVGATVFGLFFIHPLIRTQAQEEGKLRAMTETLSARSELLQHAALTDGLTGAQNRRFFDAALREYLREFRRIERPVGLILLDLDRFKQINDNHGHDAGDEVLRRVALKLKDLTRFHDVVARLGGEEFAVIVPNMNEERLGKFAEAIRNAVAALVVEVGEEKLRVTTSVGLAIWDGSEGADAFYRRADKMLYEAKRLGRNQVCA